MWNIGIADFIADNKKAGLAARFKGTALTC